MTIAKRLDELGLILPPTPASAANYVPCVVSNGTVYFAGQTPKEGSFLKYKEQAGKDLTTDQGYDVAKLCTIHLLSALHVAVEVEMIAQIS